MNVGMQTMPVNAENKRNKGLGILIDDTIANLQSAEEGTIAIIKALTGEDNARREAKATCVLEQADYMREMSDDLAGAIRQIYEALTE